MDCDELRIMLVTPCASDREDLRHLIEDRPAFHVVAEVPDGESALACARQSEPDIAVVDYSLPDTTGLGLAHVLTHRYPRMEILLHAVRNSEDWIVDALRDGIRGFVLKSGRHDHLIPALDALSHHRPYWEGAVEEDLLDELLEKAPLPYATGLTSRERQLLQLVAEGRSTNEIAPSLGISPIMVESLRTTVRRKLGLRSVADLARYALKDQSTES